MTHWTEDAACRGRMDEFFPDCETRGHVMRRAKALCLTCPVREVCLADAMERDDRYGIWGGLSSPDRKARREGLPIRNCAGCGLLFVRRSRLPICGGCGDVVSRTPVQPVSEAAAAADPRCGTPAGPGAHRRRGEQLCGPCRDARRAYDATRRRLHAVDPSKVRAAVSGAPVGPLTQLEKLQAARQLAASRLPHVEVARRLGCSPRTAARYLATARDEMTHPAEPPGRPSRTAAPTTGKEPASAA